MKFGLNLYSVRNLIQTEEDFTNTLYKLKEMGYDYVQFSGAPFDADEIKRVSLKTKMPVCLTHVTFDRIVNDTDALMEEHSRFNCKNIGLGALNPKIIRDEAEFKKSVDLLEKSAEIMEKNGFKFFYHHHNFEFFKHGDKTAFDYIVENSPHINFTLDTYWLQYGGAEITPTIKRLKGRSECVHLKDYKTVFNENGQYEPNFAPIGDGVMDFSNIIKNMKSFGVKYFLVEQDNAAILPDTLAQVERSISWLNREFN